MKKERFTLPNLVGNDRDVIVVASESAARRAWEHFDNPASVERWSKMTDGQVQAEIQAYINSLTPTADDFLGDGKDDYREWVVPDMLARGETLMLVGAPGNGKSTLIRQILVQASCGIHPWTGEDIEPVRVLLVDLQDTREHLKRELMKLRRIAGDRWNPEMFHILAGYGEGINLLDEKDQEELRNRIIETGADMVGIGPLYNMFQGTDSDDIAAQRVTDYLNGVCDWHGLLIEHHTPHVTNQGKPIERPIGSTHWMRWPEFGIHLGGDGSLRHFRGPRDAEREWPAKLRRGGEWPWAAVGAKRSEDLQWRDIRKLWVHTKRKPTVRQIEEELGITKSTAGRVMKANEADWPKS
jgi:hypothetical protein